MKSTCGKSTGRISVTLGVGYLSEALFLIIVATEEQKKSTCVKLIKLGTLERPERICLRGFKVGIVSFGTLQHDTCMIHFLIVN